MFKTPGKPGVLYFMPMPKVFIIGGVHGDEPSGALALPLLREQGLAIFGPCNPWGVEHHRRELQDGRDLNRMFAHADCAPAQAVREAVLAAQPQLLLDLHEHRDLWRPYFIQFGPGHNVARKLVRLLHRHEFEPRPRSSILRGEDGVLRPSRLALWLVGLSRRWPLAYWFWRTTGRPGVVVEAPGAWSLGRRIEFHVEVARATSALA